MVALCSDDDDCGAFLQEISRGGGVQPVSADVNESRGAQRRSHGTLLPDPGTVRRGGAGFRGRVFRVL